MSKIISEPQHNCKFFSSELEIWARFVYMKDSGDKETMCDLTIIYHDRDKYLDSRRIGGSLVEILAWNPKTEQWELKHQYTTRRTGVKKQVLNFLIHDDERYIDEHDIKIVIDGQRIKFGREQEVPEDGRRLLRKEG